MEQNSMQKAPHPAYSPDLAPSGFYLFGYVKQLMSGCQFADQDCLLLVGIEKVNLESVFHNWMKRLCQCSAPVESTWSRETFYINRITDDTVSPEMFMGRWDTLYKRSFEGAVASEKIHFLS
jgi:hypothetical protein